MQHEIWAFKYEISTSVLPLKLVAPVWLSQVLLFWLSQVLLFGFNNIWNLEFRLQICFHILQNTLSWAKYPDDYSKGNFGFGDL